MKTTKATTKAKQTKNEVINNFLAQLQKIQNLDNDAISDLKYLIDDYLTFGYGAMNDKDDFYFDNF